jgi:heme exporter protein D
MSGLVVQLVSAFDTFAENSIWWALAATVVTIVGMIVHYFDRITRGIARLRRERRIDDAYNRANDITLSVEERKKAERLLMVLLSEGRFLEGGDPDGDNGEGRDELNGSSDPDET